MKNITVLLLVMSLVFLVPRIGGAQQDDEIKMLKQEVEDLRKGQESIKKDIEELKRLTQRSAKAAPAEAAEKVVSTDDDPFMGQSTAQLTIIEFSDYQ